MELISYLPQRWREDQHPLRTLRQEMDNFFRELVEGSQVTGSGMAANRVLAARQRQRNDEEMLITAELPGVDQKRGPRLP